MSTRRAVFLSFLALLPAHAQEGLRPGETMRELETVFPGAEQWDEHGVGRVVDALTGRPIPGALVKVPNHVFCGATPEDIRYLCVARANQEGWVGLRWQEMIGYRDYIVADAPGYASTVRFDYDDYSFWAILRFPATNYLMPGTDVPVMLLDYMNRPVPGVPIGLNQGCGHIPDQRTAVTGEDGLAVVRCIDPFSEDAYMVFVTGGGLHVGAHRLSRTWRPGSPPVPIHASPGIVVTGRLLEKDGTPWAGARIGPLGWQRPWAYTAADGTFRLVGVSHDARIVVFASLEDQTLGLFGEPPKEPELSSYAPPEGVELVLMRGGEDPAAWSAVEVVLRGPGDAPAAGAELLAWRPRDGLTFRVQAGEDGRVKLRLPWGRYALRAGGSLGPWAATQAEVELCGAADPDRLEIPLHRNPTVRVDASRVLDLDITVGLTTAREFVELRVDAIHGTEVPVPAEEQALFRLSGWEDGELHVRFVEIPARNGDGSPLVVLDWVEPTRLKARLLGPDGSPVKGWLRVVRCVHDLAEEAEEAMAYFEYEETLPVAEPLARTRLVGTVDWLAVPEEESLRPAHGTLTLASAGAVMDLGEVRLEAWPEPEGPVLTLEIPEALRGEQLWIHFQARRPGRHFLHRNIDLEGSHELDQDGIVEVDPRWLRQGDELVLKLLREDDNWGFLPLNLLPLKLPIDGPPPWRAAWPRGSLSLRVSDSSGQRALSEAWVLVNGLEAPEPNEEGEVVIHGFPEGTHEIIVAESQHLPQIYRLSWREGEARRLEVRLRPRE